MRKLNKVNTKVNSIEMYSCYNVTTGKCTTKRHCNCVWYLADINYMTARGWDTTDKSDKEKTERVFAK